MVYMITYDLNKSGKDYSGVFEAIKESAQAWCHYWDSSWLIRSDLNTAAEVFEKIKPHLDSNDRCFVVEAAPNYQGWLSEEQWKFIKENIFS
jgi:hypothetical protein